MTFRYLSVCSGIEAATVAWKPLGWQCAGVSEIEKFPRAVLEHRIGAVPVDFDDHRFEPNSNLLPMFGDFTQIEDHHVGPIDLLVGGTPCQSFSIAGLRGGLGDERGGLTLEFLKLAQRTNPEWIVWENVPGVLSDKTGALVALLDGLESLGYVVDVDILDAQNHGVPQRRRRVFVCGQKAQSIVQERTISSALTIAQCLAECLALSLDVLSVQSAIDCKSWAFDVSRPAHSLQRRMRLFGIGSETTAQMLADNLAVLHKWSANEQCGSDSARGSDRSKTTEDTKSPKLTSQAAEVGEYQSTGKSWLITLDEALQVMNECITSTPARETTESKIYTCAKVMLRIAERITQSMDCSPVFWSAASSISTGLKEFTDYARTASSDLFTGLEWIQPWSDFVREATPTHNAISNLRATSFDQVLSVAESLQGHSAPRREAGKVAPTIPSRSSAGGGLGTDFDCDGGLISHDWPASVPPTLNAAFGSKMGLEDQHALNGAGCFVPGIQTFDKQAIGEYGDGSVASTVSARDYKDATDLVTHSLRGEGFDASEDGTGRGTPLVPVAYAIQERAVSDNPQNGPQGKDYQADQAFTLEARNKVQAVAFSENQQGECRISEVDNLTAGGGKPGQGYPAIAFTAQDHGADAMEDCSPTLRAGGHAKSHANAGVSPAIAFKPGSSADAGSIGAQEEIACTLEAGEGGNNRQAVAATTSVRRLTPKECSRLQGFPDDWAKIPWRGKPADQCPDGPQYKAYGNSMAVPVMAWIGRRIAQVEEIIKQQEDS